MRKLFFPSLFLSCVTLWEYVSWCHQNQPEFSQKILKKSILTALNYQYTKVFKVNIASIYVSWVVNSGALLFDEQEINE